MINNSGMLLLDLDCHMRRIDVITFRRESLATGITAYGFGLVVLELLAY